MQNRLILPDLNHQITIPLLFCSGPNCNLKGIYFLQVWNLYKQRANCENGIKELKYDFGADSFKLKSFDATEAALSWVMMAYNFISLFRQVVLNTKVEQRMKTLRYKIFAIGGYIVKNGNQRFLKLSLAMKRREWFTGLWNCQKTFEINIS